MTLMVLVSVVTVTCLGGVTCDCVCLVLVSPLVDACTRDGAQRSSRGDAQASVTPHLASLAGLHDLAHQGLRTLHAAL